MNPPTPTPPAVGAGFLDSVTDTLGGFRSRGVLTRALMSSAHVSSRSRGKSAALFGITSLGARKRTRVRESFHFFHVSVRTSCNGRKNSNGSWEKRGGGDETNRPNRKVSVCALTARDVGRAELLLKLFGGDFWKPLPPRDGPTPPSPFAAGGHWAKRFCKAERTWHRLTLVWRST